MDENGRAATKARRERVWSCKEGELSVRAEKERAVEERAGTVLEGKDREEKREVKGY